jgi:heptosyltransferase-2
MTIESHSDKPVAPGRPVIVRLRNWVGDVVLGLPALKALQAAGYSPVLVARGRWARDLLKGMPWPVHIQPKGLRQRVRQLRELRTRMQALDPTFNLRANALVLPQSFSSALEMRLAGLRAVGYQHEARGWLLRGKANPPALPRQGHVSEHYFRLAHWFLSPDPSPPHPAPADFELAIDPSAKAQAINLRAQHDVGEQYLVICPFAGGKSSNQGLDKSWPHFEAFLKLASRELNLPLVICPGPGELMSAQTRFPEAVCIENTSLDVYAALLQGAALVIAIDTGPGHMAAASGAPLLSLMGPTPAEDWGPKGPRVELAMGYPQWPTAQHILARAQAILTQGKPDAAQGSGCSGCSG